MSHQSANRVQETTTTTGTGALTLAGASTGYRPFSAVCANGDTAYYSVYSSGGTEWEVGLGTWGTGGILTRTTVLASSNSGSLVSFSAGTKTVSLTATAEKTLQQDANNQVQMDTTSTTVTPASGKVKFYARNLASRAMMSWMDSSGLEVTAQPHNGRNRNIRWQPIGNATTVPTVEGIAAATAVGTATARNVATTNIATRVKRLGYVSAATAGSLSGHYFTVAQWTVGNGAGLGGFHYIEQFVVSDAAAVSGARQFVGMSSNISAPTNVEANTLTNSIGLAQLSTDATQWYMVYGGSAAQTAIALGTTIGAPTLTTTVWEFHLFSGPGSNNTVGYTLINLGTGVTVSGTLTGTAGTALPASSTFLAPRAWRTNNATALAVGLDIGSMYIETDQ